MKYHESTYIKDNQVAVLLEEINGKLDAVAEVVGGSATDVGSLKTDVQSIDERLSRVEADVKVIKATVTDQNRTVETHEARIGRLEERAA